MILVDLNQVMISNLMAQIGSHKGVEVKEDLLRHMVDGLYSYKVCTLSLGRLGLQMKSLVWKISAVPVYMKEVSFKDCVVPSRF